jgi:type IV pilus assembly protein PilV
MQTLTLNAMSSCTHRRDRARATGFTLVEVLVALLVISIGLLGVAKLVLAAVKANDSSYLRGQATALAYSILDDMRANHAYAVSNLGYVVGYGAYPDPGFTCNGVASTCTPAQIAQYDLYIWKQQLSAASAVTSGALPSGDGQITMNVSATGQVTATITVKWDDSIAQWAFGTPSNATPTFTTFTLESGL